MLAERERLAREIHDTVTQGLTSSLLRLEAAEQIWAQADPRTEARAREDVRVATGTLRENLAETRSLVHHLAAPNLESQPIDAALLAAARTHHPRAELRIVGSPIAIPAEVTHALLRITQSAVSNIARHAHAETVGVTLTYLPDAVALDIFDDGTGFEPAPTGSPSARGGYGLRAMRSRVEQLGGTFTVESAPGEGTVVAAQIPCARGTAA